MAVDILKTDAVDAVAPAHAHDSAKRRQLMDGARRVFLELGFDGASVGDIVKAAGISKGTLYAYFPSKEILFETLVIEARQKQAEVLCSFDDGDTDVAKVLTRLGNGILAMLIEPDHLAFLRIVIASSAKFPAIGRAFYDAGPKYGATRLSAYLGRMTAMHILQIPDPDLAARQFFDLCKTGIHIKMMLGYAEQPSDEERLRNVQSAVAVFMKAYGR